MNGSLVSRSCPSNQRVTTQNQEYISIEEYNNVIEYVKHIVMVPTGYTYQKDMIAAARETTEIESKLGKRLRPK